MTAGASGTVVVALKAMKRLPSAASRIRSVVPAGPAPPAMGGNGGRDVVSWHMAGASSWRGERMVASASMTATSDVVDRYGDRAAVCATEFRQFGGVTAFEGVMSTVRCFEDNVLVKRRASESGDGRVLVVDGGGSTRIALLGDMVASLARDHGWEGLVVNGCVRDVAALRELPIGIKALGSTPLPSGKQGDGEIDVSVTFGDVVFTPGSLLYSDDDGIVIVRRAPPRSVCISKRRDRLLRGASARGNARGSRNPAHRPE